jgi:hypothetical protein
MLRNQASTQLARMSKLYQAADVSRLTEEAQRDRDVAEVQFQQAHSNEELVNAGPLPEELERADADLQSAEAGINLAEKLRKCVVRAPHQRHDAACCLARWRVIRFAGAASAVYPRGCIRAPRPR